ncbi:MAG: hypothetical protein QNL04_11285 [SAR324 cluster bacterium]|nr:hypothetical protein [SAR324 cluster bacterium]
MMKNLIMGLVCTLGFTTSGMAQIATAPLDPTQPVLTGAAAGWRMKAAAVGSYFTGTGKLSIENEDFYEYTRNGNSAGITIPWGPVAFEASSVNWSQQTTLTETYSDEVPVSFASAEAHLGLNHEQWASIGVSAKDVSEKTYLDGDVTEDANSENSLGGSLSLQMGGSFFLAAGTRDVKSSGDSVVDNRWKETQVGVGMIFGSPEETRFRLESSFAKSPEKQKQAFGDKSFSYHPKTEIDYNQVEFSISGLLFAVREEREKSTSKYTGDDGVVYSDTMVAVLTETGVLWVPQNGLVLGFYFVNEKTTDSFEDTQSSFKIHSGYVF